MERPYRGMWATDVGPLRPPPLPPAYQALAPVAMTLFIPSAGAAGASRGESTPPIAFAQGKPKNSSATGALSTNAVRERALTEEKHFSVRQRRRRRPLERPVEASAVRGPARRRESPRAASGRKPLPGATR